MRYLFIVGNGSSASFESVLPEDEVLLAIIADKNTPTNTFERKLSQMKLDAERIGAKLSSKGVKSKVLIEWGTKEEIVQEFLRRENAVLI